MLIISTISHVTVTIAPSDSTRNLSVIFYSSLTMYDHIFSVSESCFLFIRDLGHVISEMPSTLYATLLFKLLLPRSFIPK